MAYTKTKKSWGIKDNRDNRFYENMHKSNKYIASFDLFADFLLHVFHISLLNIFLYVWALC